MMLGHVLSMFCLLFTFYSIASNQTFDALHQASYSAFASITFSFFFGWWIVAAQFGSKSEFARRLRYPYYEILMILII